jgi:hypothetical protein
MPMIHHIRYCLAITLALVLGLDGTAHTAPLQLNDRDYFETPGLNVLVFSNRYDGLFSDAKISGVEIIHHGVRTATNGDVRLQATPEQWDAVPVFVDRNVDRQSGTIRTRLRYPDFQFTYYIEVQPTDDGVIIGIDLEQPVPVELQGSAGFNLEFLPSAYFGKSYIVDNRPGIFPLHPAGPREQNGKVRPRPLATGNTIVLAPEDRARMVTIESNEAELAIYDGRAKAQNGWFVIRSLLPADRSGRVLEWTLRAKTIDDWLRDPVIAHSQVGYHPEQNKLAVIELDRDADREIPVTLYKVNADGDLQSARTAQPVSWGDYKRYHYQTFDFSRVREPGIYVLEYGPVRTAPFRIATDVHANTWFPTLDVFMPVQMDHVTVNEAYRVWHGASHLDDALQAPTDHEHFDLYAQGPETDTPFEPGEHIPGLNVGGWYDAGDYDIRTQTQYQVVNRLVDVWEEFGLDRDNTSVDYARKFVDLHVADGKPDLLQQIEHGTLALVAQHRAVGHAIAGIIVPDLSQYTHLGDGLTMTDNLIFNPDLGELESNGFESGVFDDRWAFTTRSSALNYGSIAALAAASRALRGYNDALASESLEIALRAWDDEQSGEPSLFQHGNTTGGPLLAEKMKAVLELLVTTEEARFAEIFLEFMPEIEKGLVAYADYAVRAIPYMDAKYKASLKALAKQHREFLDNQKMNNPFGVMITEFGWAGNSAVVQVAINNYYLHKAFPDLIKAEDVYLGLNFLYGTHPDSDISFVSAVGAHSKKVAYGMNRADFSFIAGGVVPGVLILKPDFPENKEDWPFLWGENEYVVSLAAHYLFLAAAAADLLGSGDD